MTELPDPEAGGAAPATTPEAGSFASGDPELAALVSRPGDPDLAALVRPAPEPVAPAVAPAAYSVAPAIAVVTARAPHRRRSLAARFAISFLLGIALVVGIGAGALYAWGRQYDGRVLPGVRVGATDLSGLTRDQAVAAIAAGYASLTDGKIVLRGPDGPTVIGYKDIARGPDTSAILDAALAAGRDGEPLADLIGAPRLALHGVTVASAVTYDRTKLAAAVDAMAAAVDITPSDAAITRTGGSYAVVAARNGRAVDKAALMAALDQTLAALDAPREVSFDVPVRSVPPAVATEAAETARAAAERMAANLVIARGSDTWTVPGSQLAALISFTTAADGTVTPVFDDGGLDPVLAGLAKQVNQSAQAAGLKLVGNHVVATGVSREGRTLDVVGMRAAIVSQIAARQVGNATEPLAAVVAAVDPALSKAQADAFAAQMRPIRSFSVFYWVIINNHFGGNIEAPATKINGTVVPAGATFDFWEAVGDLHKLPGEGPGNAIEGGKITVTGAFGGGICTTSTTLFNAAFRAGMVPLARQNHNEFINRYPPGLDATVWIIGSTKQTMSFKNDTEFPILITRTITDAGSKRWLTFKIWSVPNGRSVKVTDLVIKPGAKAIDTVVNDPTKPVGYTFRNNSPVDGAEVWVTVTIYDHGKLHWTKRYYSKYPAVNGVLIVGTKVVT
jgi:vancomycin resistance protein YoaR